MVRSFVALATVLAVAAAATSVSAAIELPSGAELLTMAINPKSRAAFEQQHRKKKQSTPDACCVVGCRTTPGGSCGSSNATYCPPDDCSGDVSCENGACVASYSLPLGATCTNAYSNECVRGTECRYQANNGTTDFQAPTTCQHYWYVAPGGACTSDNACDWGGCINGICEIYQQGESCASCDNCCASGFTCDDNTEICVPELTAGATCDINNDLCAERFVCDGTCREFGSNPKGAVCTPNGVLACSTFYCDPDTLTCEDAPAPSEYTGGPCDTDADCLTTESCECNENTGERQCIGSFAGYAGNLYTQCKTEFDAAFDCFFAPPGCVGDGGANGPPGTQCCLDELQAFQCCTANVAKCQFSDLTRVCEGDFAAEGCELDQCAPAPASATAAALLVLAALVATLF